MGCSCSSKGYLRIKFGDNLHSRNLNKQSSSLTSMHFSSVDSILLHFNVLIWASNLSNFYINFPSAYMTYKLHSDIMISLILLPYQLQPNQSIVFDCMLFIYETPDDAQQIKNFLSTHKKICIKFMLATENSMLIDEEIKVVNDANSFMEEIYVQHVKLEKGIKAVFDQVDEDGDRMINAQEAEKALGKLGSCDEEARKVVGIVEVEEKIDFHWFSYYWRRGRQGGGLMKNYTGRWAEVVSEKFPVMKAISGTDVTVKTKLSKCINITVGEQCECKLGINLFIGNSAYREEVLRNITSQLNLNIFECWVAFTIKYKSAQIASLSLYKIEEVILSIKSTLLAGITVAKDLGPGIQHKISLNDSSVFVCIIFDISNDHISEALEFLKPIDLMFKSPVDDFIDIKITRKEGLEDLVKTKDEDFVKSLRDGMITITSEHWSVYKELIQPRNKFERIIRKFLTIEGKVNQVNPKSHGINSLMRYLDLLMQPIRRITAGNLLALRLFKSLGTEIFPEIEISIRYNNIGAKLGITCEDLRTLFI